MKLKKFCLTSLIFCFVFKLSSELSGSRYWVFGLNICIRLYAFKIHHPTHRSDNWQRPKLAGWIFSLHPATWINQIRSHAHAFLVRLPCLTIKCNIQIIKVKLTKSFVTMNSVNWFWKRHLKLNKNSLTTLSPEFAARKPFRFQQGNPNGSSAHMGHSLSKPIYKRLKMKNHVSV